MKICSKNWVLFWRSQEVVWWIELGISVEGVFAGLYLGNNVILGSLCRDRDVRSCEDLPEVDDPERLQFSVHEREGVTE